MRARSESAARESLQGACGSPGRCISPFRYGVSRWLASFVAPSSAPFPAWADAASATDRSLCKHPCAPQHESPNLSKALVWDTSSADNFDARRWTRTLAHESDTNPVSQRDRRTGAAQPQMTYREQNKTMHIPTVSRLEPKGSLKVRRCAALLPC